MNLPTPLQTRVYTAVVTADAGRDGSVRSDNGALSLPLGRPPGMGGSHEDGNTNPEQLFAAGYAACFHSALLFIARQQRITAAGSAVTASVTIGKVDDGGFGLDVTLEVDLPDVEEADAQRLIDAAHAACPYSRATRGNIEVEVRRRT